MFVFFLARSSYELLSDFAFFFSDSFSRKAVIGLLESTVFLAKYHTFITHVREVLKHRQGKSETQNMSENKSPFQ